MSALLALCSSLMFGTGDYIGGHLSKKHKTMAVTGAIQVIGLIIGLILLLMTGTWIAPTLSWNGYFLPGVCAGLIGFIGLNAFFAGLATGRMGVVSPISSLSVMIPVLYSLIHGERPSSLAIVGMVIAILGAFFGSGPEIRGGLGLKPLLFGALAALCFGGSVLFLTFGSKSNVLLTAVSMRLAVVTVLSILILRFRPSNSFSIKDFRFLFVAGAFDFLANITLGQASTLGLVSSAVVMASLYPLVTSVWAFKFSHERLHKLQYVGIIFAVAGVSLISLG